MAGVGWCVSDALQDIGQLAIRDSESSHILLAPVVFLWLAWIRRDQLSPQPKGGRWPGALLLVSGAVLWTFGYRYQVQTLWHLGAIMAVAGAAGVAMGSAALVRFAAAWGALIFLVPIPARGRLWVSIPLQQLTAMATQFIGEGLGWAVGRSGNQLSLNGVNVCVAEACNGMRMAFSLLIACYLFAFASPLRPLVRLVILLLSPVVAVACNVIRLLPTLWFFGHTSNGVAEKVHDVAGWLMLVVAFAGLTGVVHFVGWLGVRTSNGSNWEGGQGGLTAAAERGSTQP